MGNARFEGKRAALYTLGCKVNEYETDAMRAALKEAGFSIVDFRETADVYVINTCSVTNIADRKSRQMISRAKRNNPDAVVAAAGCYVQTALEKTGKPLEADILIGSGRKSRLTEELERYFAAMEASRHGRQSRNVADVMHESEYEEMLLPSIESHTRAWIKVQDGCNQFCSYCIIPFARGRIRSRRMDDVLSELKGLAAEGIREVVLTGIHLSSYGTDLEDGLSLIDLIEKTARIDGIDRVRLGSLEPGIITEEFIERLRGIPEICPHFHLSLQSGCDSVLKRMNRHYTTQEYKESLSLLRSAFDRPAITTDVIVGFPGETEDEFACTRQFLEEIQLYETHLFRYSMRAGTRAAHMPDQIPESVKESRLSVLDGIDKKMRERFERSWDNSMVEVLFEEAVQIDEHGFIHVPNSSSPVRFSGRAPLHTDNREKLYTGFTREYIRVFACSGQDLRGQVMTGKRNGLLLDSLMKAPESRTIVT